MVSSFLMERLTSSQLGQLCEVIQEGFGPCSEQILTAGWMAVCGPLVELCWHDRVCTTAFDSLLLGPNTEILEVRLPEVVRLRARAVPDGTCSLSCTATRR